MGKAIVINGLTVANPLCVVNIETSPVDAALKAYYAANTSISSDEKTALETFVQGLIDANLWSKMAYFYPLVGDNVDDMILDAVSPSTEDLLTGISTAGLSVNSRALIANNRQQAYGTTSSRAQSLDQSKIGFVMAANLASGTAGGQGFFFRSTSNIGVNVVSANGNKEESFDYGSGSIDITEASGSYLERIVFGNIADGTATLYRDTAVRGTAEADTSAVQTSATYGVLYNYRSTDFQYNFFAITQGMTDSDWETYYPLLLTFLQSVGKHS